jgi:uncharacterized membrane protein
MNLGKEPIDGAHTVRNRKGSKPHSLGALTPMRLGCLSLLVALGLMIVLPFAFADLMSAALLKLQLDSRTAFVIILGIFAGSLVNIPITRVVRTQPVATDPLAVYGLHGLWPGMRHSQSQTIVAVNLGGCVIPTGLALYEAAGLVGHGEAIVALSVAVLLNVLVCHRVARPVAGIGIVMPPLVPATLAAATALIATPTHATPVAFVAGILGPLVGADLLNLGALDRIESGIVSIGGAGTFDGILLSGIVALYLA